MSQHHSTRPQVIPTYRVLNARRAAFLINLTAGMAIAAAVLLVYAWADKPAAADNNLAAQKAGHLAGYAEAIADIGPTVASAWQQGYLAGQANTCNPNRREAPL